jgi:sortase A
MTGIVVAETNSMLRNAEYLAWIAAALLIAAGAGSGIASCGSQQARLAAFDTAVADARVDQSTATNAVKLGPPDRSDWSSARARKYQQLRASYKGLPDAVLRIPAIGLEAEIFDDTGARSLDLGVGHIEGTARLGEHGNVGLAGHRDGYFRRLKNIRAAQAIHIVTTRGEWTYEVQRTEVVDPSAVRVLAPTARPSLTLVTCYPFYFLGNAPKRFIVHARLVPSETATTTEETT